MIEIPPEGLILNVYKPAGMTSFDVVRQVRRRLKVKKVGHGGTLDPIAEGVLLIMAGKATKRANELSSLDKTYAAGILLGRKTDTYDTTGVVLAESDTDNIEYEDIERELQNFIGEIEQVPPMFSAIKIDGKRLYKLARRGIQVERKPRKIIIYDIRLKSWMNPSMLIVVHCSKGTYIRSLAEDIGDRLGCGGCMESLVRTRIGDYRVEDSIRLEDMAG
ncbi:MAG: tRNA pseudouridine(55) synthase TruB [candidate division Zixibacteria bacterium]|nr:tRNA pseudouridine(55) synthase TruB [Candidatus Tariuqbacter arcticus]